MTSQAPHKTPDVWADRVDAYVQLGEYALDLGRPAPALAAWRRAVELDPSRTDVQGWADALEAELERRGTAPESPGK